MPAPVWPTKAMVSPGSHVQVDVVEHGHAFDVVEVDVVEVDAALDVVEVDGVGRVLDLRLGVEHLDDALAAGHGALELRVLQDEVADRVEEAAGGEAVKAMSARDVHLRCACTR